MSVFVLVHGAWHDGSGWHSTARHLESRAAGLSLAEKTIEAGRD